MLLALMTFYKYKEHPSLENVQIAYDCNAGLFELVAESEEEYLNPTEKNFHFKLFEVNNNDNNTGGAAALLSGGCRFAP